MKTDISFVYDIIDSKIKSIMDDAENGAEEYEYNYLDLQRNAASELRSVKQQIQEFVKATNELVK
jgi:hypothetical protein